MSQELTISPKIKRAKMPDLKTLKTEDKYVTKDGNLPKLTPIAKVLLSVKYAANEFSAKKFYSALSYYSIALNSAKETLKDGVKEKKLKAGINLSIAETLNETNEWEKGKPLALKTMQDLVNQGVLSKDSMDFLEAYIYRNERGEFFPDSLKNVNQFFGYTDPRFVENSSSRPELVLTKDLKDDLSRKEEEGKNSEIDNLFNGRKKRNIYIW